MAILPFVSTAAARDATSSSQPIPLTAQKRRHESSERLCAGRKGSGMRAAGRYAPRCKSIGHSARQQSSHSTPAQTQAAHEAARQRKASSTEPPNVLARPHPMKSCPPHPRPAESRRPTPAPRNQAPHSPRTKKVRPAHAGRTLTLSSDNRRRCVHRVTQAAPRWSREPPPPR